MRWRFIPFLLLFSLTSCWVLTKSGRQQHAYESYICKSSVMRERQRVKFKTGTSTLPLRSSEPSLVRETERPESPESVTAAPTESPPR